jgi:hypothetical protein
VLPVHCSIAGPSLGALSGPSQAPVNLVEISNSVRCALLLTPLGLGMVAELRHFQHTHLLLSIHYYSEITSRQTSTQAVSRSSPISHWFYWSHAQRRWLHCHSWDGMLLHSKSKWPMPLLVPSIPLARNVLLEELCVGHPQLAPGGKQQRGCSKTFRYSHSFNFYCRACSLKSPKWCGLRQQRTLLNVGLRKPTNVALYGEGHLEAVEVGCQRILPFSKPKLSHPALGCFNQHRQPLQPNTCIHHNHATSSRRRPLRTRLCT